MWHDTLATVTQNEVFETFEEEKEHGFYHIKLSEEVDAWLSFVDSEPVITGFIYTGTIPSTMTLGPNVVYRISAEDIHHNKISTLPYTIQIIKPEKPEKPPVKEAEKVAAKKGIGSIIKSKWFIGGAAIVTTGVVIAILSSKSDKNKGLNNGSININGEW